MKNLKLIYGMAAVALVLLSSGCSGRMYSEENEVFHNGNVESQTFRDIKSLKKTRL